MGSLFADRMRSQFFKAKSIRYLRPLLRAWDGLAFYWHTRDRSNWLFFLLLALPAIAVSLVTYFSLTQRDDNQQLVCLALNVYHEARGEPVAGQYAVAEVTMNRVASSRYPNTVCEVVYEKNWDYIRRRYVAGFSWTEFDSVTKPEARMWQQAWDVANAVYFKRHAPKLEGVLFYHARHIRPSWARGKKPVARIGRHVFYKESHS